MDTTAKAQALDFLKELEKTLNSKLRGPTEMEPWIRSRVAAAKNDDKQKHLRFPEAAFLNGGLFRYFSRCSRLLVDCPGIRRNGCCLMSTTTRLAVLVATKTPKLI